MLLDAKQLPERLSGHCCPPPLTRQRSQWFSQRFSVDSGLVGAMAWAIFLFKQMPEASLGDTVAPPKSRVSSRVSVDSGLVSAMTAVL